MSHRLPPCADLMVSAQPVARAALFRCSRATRGIAGVSVTSGEGGLVVLARWRVGRAACARMPFVDGSDTAEPRVSGKDMLDRQDAFGHELYDYLNGIESVEIVERDDGWIGDSGGAAAYFAGYTDWPPIEKTAMRYVRGKVLDIGCGAGRHALYLEKRGFDVLGIDQSPLAITVCESRGLKQARVMSIAQVSSRLGTFDTVLMLGHNFGLFGDFATARRLLRRFHRTSANSARIIATTLDPHDTEDHFHHEYHARNRDRGRMPGQVRIRVRYRKYRTPWFDYLFVSRDEMGQILRDTGWRVKRFIDSDGPSYAAIIDKQTARRTT